MPANHKEPNEINREGWMLRSTASYGVLAALLFGGACQAAEADNGVLDEVIVTAQKRAEHLVDVPVAITAFGEEQLDRRGATKFTDIAMSVPNMVFEQAADIRNQRISIRGISADTRF